MFPTAAASRARNPVDTLIYGSLLVYFSHATLNLEEDDIASFPSSTLHSWWCFMRTLTNFWKWSYFSWLKKIADFIFNTKLKFCPDLTNLTKFDMFHFKIFPRKSWWWARFARRERRLWFIPSALLQFGLPNLQRGKLQPAGSNASECRRNYLNHSS